MRIWLQVLFALVVIMIAVGGLTRLTDSGLSITEWAPLSGAVPPLSAEDWEAEFAAYREIPEYQLQNRGMSLAEFKVIYWWEWGHRQLGRVIGLVWALGFRRASGVSRHAARLDGARGASGCAWAVLQGAIGWWMVSSGLAPGMLDVASYRLAIHLGLAFVILALIAWYVLRLGREEAELMSARREGDRRLKGMATGVLHLSFAADPDRRAGGRDRCGPELSRLAAHGRGVLPPDMWAIEPWWRNLFENDGTVQFIHRMVGYVLLVVGAAAWLAGRRSARDVTRAAFHAMMLMLVLQIVLGIVTVLYSAPWYFAILHQFGAVVLVVMILRARFYAMYPLRQSVRGARP
jgi:cytochrome c oxidase assembly protein subunit 15